MNHCFDELKKIGWECNTHDQKIFECTCCNFGHSENCNSSYFKNAFHVHSNQKPNANQPIYDSYYDEFFAVSENNFNIESLEHMYHTCKVKQILPLWCQVISVSRNHTICGCHNQFGKERVAPFHFNTKDIWNDHLCEITDEQNIFLHNQGLNIRILGILLFILSLLVLFIILKVIQRFTKKNSSQEVDNIELMNM